MGYAEISLSDLRDLLEPDPEPEPHPALVASIRPSPADLFAATAYTGWLSHARYLSAVPIRLEDLVAHVPRLP